MGRMSSFRFRSAAFIVLLVMSGGGQFLLADELELQESYLITRQPESFQKAWREVDELVRENKSLDRPLPDPLFARGDLWATLGNHEEALEDYLSGTKLLLAGQPTLVEQSSALGRLSDALERLAKRPRPEYPVEAQQAFLVGVEHFEHRRTELAAAY